MTHTRLPVTARGLANSSGLLKDGYDILRGAVEPEFVAEIEADLADRFERTPFCEGGFYGERTKRFGRLLIRSPGIERLVCHPDILALAEAALGPWCERIQLNLTQAIELHPGALAQFPHRDQDMWMGEQGRTEYLVNFIWPLTPFTAGNGATLIWPGSHGVRFDSDTGEGPAIAAEAHPGDAIVFLGSTLHGAGANRSFGVRRGIIIVCGRVDGGRFGGPGRLPSKAAVPQAVPARCDLLRNRA